MKILQLCKKFPYPLKDGESIAVTYLSKAMSGLGADITLLAMNTRKHYTPLDELPDTFDHYDEMYEVPKDNRLKLTEAFYNLFSSESLHIQRYVDDRFNDKLKEVLQRHTFDIIQLETLYLAPYIPVIRAHSRAAVVMRAHNVEFEIWEKLASNSRLWLKKWYLGTLARKLRNYELDMLSEYDLLVAITNRDMRRFQAMGYEHKGVVAPIGIDVSDYEVHSVEPKNRSSISFIGSLDWRPNREGLSWFVDEVWTSLKAKNPDVELHIAGRNTPRKIFEYDNDRIEVHGEVPSANRFISSHPLMIVPLFSGSGMRAKILEGMALGRTVITTALGLNGIPARDGIEVLIANTAEEFIDRLNHAMARPEEMRALGKNARKLVDREFDNVRIARDLLQQYGEL